MGKKRVSANEQDGVTSKKSRKVERNVLETPQVMHQYPTELEADQQFTRLPRANVRLVNAGLKDVAVCARNVAVPATGKTQRLSKHSNLEDPQKSLPKSFLSRRFSLGSASLRENRPSVRRRALPPQR